MTRIRILSTLIVWLVVSLALWLTDADPSVFALAGIVAVVSAIGLVLFDLGGSAQTVRWPRPPEPNPAEESLTERIPRPLRDVEGAVRSHPTGLWPRLAALVEHRLATRHRDRGVTPDDDVLTPSLRRLVVSPTGRIRSTRELTALIDEIEAL